MSKYNSQRKRNMYVPGKPFKLSRSKIDLYMNCPRCFYVDRVLGTGMPPGYPFTLNLAVDALLKKEFDCYRDVQGAHPLLIKNGLDLVPAKHEKLKDWRFNFEGVQYLHEPTGLTITGAIDDLWRDDECYYVPDYKATARNEEVIEINPDYGYGRQMEIYQWLLRRNGLNVSNTGYFVYANGDKSKDAFNAKLEFRMSLIPYLGDDSWVEQAIIDAHKCLNGPLPSPSDDCDYCNYFEARVNHVVNTPPL